MTQSSQSETTTGEIDASCRHPLTVLFGFGALWLVLGCLINLVASIKFHAPGFLAGHHFGAYGRLQAAGESALLYGFGVPTALGVGFWLLARLGQTPLVGKLTIVFAALFWNLAVLAGIAGIFRGDLTGYESFQLPGYVSTPLFTAYLVMGICAVLTFHQRTRATLYPSQWFVLASVFWFVWILSTVLVLLICQPVRGMLQAGLAWWYAHNLRTIVLGMAALGSIHYFIPKLLNRPLHSYYLAAMGFWTWLLFGSWGGISDGAPLPAWIASLSVVGTVLTVIPVLCLGVNLCQTLGRDFTSVGRDPVLRFCYASLACWLVACGQRIVGAQPAVNSLVGLTTFGVAEKELFFFGFVSFALFGAIYYILPRLLQTEWPCTKLHFYLTAVGLGVSWVSLLAGGTLQGTLLSQPRHSFVEAMVATDWSFKFDSLGLLLVALGQVWFAGNLAVMLVRSARACLAACCARVERTKTLAAVEVRA